MLNVEIIRKVRQAFFRDGKGIREITRELSLSPNTIRAIIRSGKTDQDYERIEQRRPKLGSFVERLPMSGLSSSLAASAGEVPPLKKNNPTRSTTGFDSVSSQQFITGQPVHHLNKPNP